MKYRVWDKKEKKWDKTTLISQEGYVVLPDSTCLIHTYWHSNDDITISQYTGLEDMHGKEIYEGDILQTDSSIGSYLVKYNKGFYLELALPNFNKVILNEETNTERLEIIGNIYENPELFGVKNSFLKQMWE